jgi:hypothetical protein
VEGIAKTLEVDSEIQKIIPFTSSAVSILGLSWKGQE